jgi:putative FmdB family regulatory protein
MRRRCAGSQAVRERVPGVDTGAIRDKDCGTAAERVAGIFRSAHMPTYEYVCQKCGHAFECVQSMSAAPLEECPKESCPKSRWGHGRVKRGVGGGAGLIFKGSGFYITDYRSDGYKSAAKADTSGSSSGSSKSETKSAAASDSKPAASSKSGASTPAASKGGKKSV